MVTHKKGVIMSKTRTCAWCGVEFQPRTSTRRHCAKHYPVYRRKMMKEARSRQVLREKIVKPVDFTMTGRVCVGCEQWHPDADFEYKTGKKTPYHGCKKGPGGEVLCCCCARQSVGIKEPQRGHGEPDIAKVMQFFPRLIPESATAATLQMAQGDGLARILGKIGRGDVQYLSRRRRGA